MALDLDERNGASYQKTCSGEENNNSNHNFLIDEPIMSADNGLSHGVSHSRGARVGVYRKVLVFDQQEARSNKLTPIAGKLLML